MKDGGSEESTTSHHMLTSLVTIGKRIVATGNPDEFRSNSTLQPLARFFAPCWIRAILGLYDMYTMHGRSFFTSIVYVLVLLCMTRNLGLVLIRWQFLEGKSWILFLFYLFIYLFFFMMAYLYFVDSLIQFIHSFYWCVPYTSLFII
jgi:hypothetical protein